MIFIDFLFRLERQLIFQPANSWQGLCQLPYIDSTEIRTPGYWRPMLAHTCGYVTSLYICTLTIMSSLHEGGSNQPKCLARSSSCSVQQIVFSRIFSMVLSANVAHPIYTNKIITYLSSFRFWDVGGTKTNIYIYMYIYIYTSCIGRPISYLFGAHYSQMPNDSQADTARRRTRIMTLLPGLPMTSVQQVELKPCRCPGPHPIQWTSGLENIL